MSNRVYNKVARAEAEERTRDALLAAAGRAFFTGGWDATSLDAIAKDAGVSKPTLLRHFGSKDGLLEAAYSGSFKGVMAQRFAAPTDDVTGAVDNLLDHYEEHGDRALALGAMSGSAAIERIGRRARTLHYEWVDHAFGRWLGAMPSVRRERTRGALIAICDVHTWALLARDLDFDRRSVRATLLMTIKPLLGEDE